MLSAGRISAEPGGGGKGPENERSGRRERISKGSVFFDDPPQEWRRSFFGGGKFFFFIAAREMLCIEILSVTLKKKKKKIQDSIELNETRSKRVLIDRWRKINGKIFGSSREREFLATRLERGIISRGPGVDSAVTPGQLL